MNLEVFMKQNQEQPQEQTYAPTTAIKDGDGSPVLWTFRQLKSRDVEKIRQRAIKTETQKDGKADVMFDNERYTNSIIVSATVYPNLNDANLQDSYGVRTPGDLLYELVKNPNEYQALLAFVNNLSDVETLDELTEQAKN